MRIKKTSSSILAALALCACVGQTPIQQYFELKQHYATAIRFAASYRKECDLKPKADPCKAVVKDMQRLDTSASFAFAKADDAFFNTEVEPDATYKEIVLQNAKVALKNLQNLILGTAK